MNAPQIIMIVLLALNLFINLLKHGEKQGSYSFWTSLVNAGIVVGLLWWGGFWG